MQQSAAVRATDQHLGGAFSTGSRDVPLADKTSYYTTSTFNKLIYAYYSSTRVCLMALLVYILLLIHVVAEVSSGR